MPHVRPTPTATLPPCTQVRWYLTHHPCLVAAWVVPFSLMASATYFNSDDAARWAVLCGMFALLLSCAALSQWLVGRVTTRMVEIVSYWEEDVRRPRRDLRVVPTVAPTPRGADEATPS